MLSLGTWHMVQLIVDIIIISCQYQKGHMRFWKGWSQLPILGINNDKNCLDLYMGYKLTNKNHLLHWKSVNTLANLLEALLPKYKQTGTHPHTDTMPCNSTFPRPSIPACTTAICPRSIYSQHNNHHSSLTLKEHITWLYIVLLHF